VFHRPRILLAFLHRHHAAVGKTQLMKWLFLLGAEHVEYHVPGIGIASSQRAAVSTA